MSESKNHQIMHAQIDWSDQSEPFSTLFSDLYFNTDQGINESRYVFLEGNQLLERWINCDSDSFTIAESGFGTGLNFLVTCLLFEQFLKEFTDKPLKKLFFVSFEKYPLSKQDLQSSLNKWPILDSYIDVLLKQYPLALIGCHRMQFSHINLDLWLGDIQESLSEMYIYENGLFDCWYLDGFSPNKNPEMWSQSLFDLMAKSCKKDATLATFTAAGFVKRGLQQAGFSISKRKGYGKKREMLVGHLAKLKPSTEYAHHYRACKTTNNKEVAIIGGGISSACLSLALVKRGFNVTLYCKDKHLATGASGNQQGALYPLLNAQHDALSQLFANSFLFARNYVESINQNHPFDFDLSGLLQLYYDKNSSFKLDKILKADLPKALVHKTDDRQTDKLADLDIGLDALFYPNAGWLNPKQMVTAIFKEAQQSGLLNIQFNHRLTEFKQQQSGWLCTFAKQQTKQQTNHQLLILTTAMHTLDFKQCEALPLSAARGQVTHIESNPELHSLKKTLCHEGYLTPINNGFHCMGATFKRHEMDETFSQSEQKENKDKLAKCIKDKAWVHKINTQHENAKVGIRCTTRDHFPYMGALADYSQTKENYKNAQKEMPTDNAPFFENLFVLTGLGSRGLNTAPLLAESLASQINNEPIPLSLSILNSLQCNRQWINYLKKGKALKF